MKVLQIISCRQCFNKTYRDILCAKTPDGGFDVSLCGHFCSITGLKLNNIDIINEKCPLGE